MLTNEQLDQLRRQHRARRIQEQHLLEERRSRLLWDGAAMVTGASFLAVAAALLLHLLRAGAA